MKIKSAEGKSLELSDVVFGCEYNETLVHQAVVSYMSAGRSGTKAQKSRSDVSGGGIKPWRQKGTGRARAGTSRGPIWRKGGVTFAARPRSYVKKLNKKMYRSAMRCMFSELLRSDSLVVGELELSDSKTKSAVSMLGGFGVSSSVLLVADKLDDSVRLSTRNIPGCQYVDVNTLSPVALINHDKVIVTPVAMAKIQEWLA